MARYILKRLLWIIPVVLGVTIMVFTIMYLTPGDPARMILGSNATEEKVEELHEQLGMNGNYFQRLGRYMKQVFIDHDLGSSYYTGVRVTDQIKARLPFTLRIAGISILIAACIGIPLGVLAATHHYTWIDNLAMFGSLFCVSMPGFWFALILVSFFAIKLGWLPAVGIRSWTGYILPCVSGTIGGAAGLARQTRSSMLEVIRQDYITTARAKGQTERKVIFQHALKNAMIPIITVLGSMFGSSLGGALIIETIFSIPGMGTYLTDAISKRDYPIIQGGVLFISICFCLIMLIVDIIYAFVDPRIRSQYAGKGKKKQKKEVR